MNNTKSLKDYFEIEELILFGSKSEGSDIDILIISDDFYQISISKRKELVKNIDNNYDPICMTKNEYRIFVKENGSLATLIHLKGRAI